LYLLALQALAMWRGLRLWCDRNFTAPSTAKINTEVVVLAAATMCGARGQLTLLAVLADGGLRHLRCWKATATRTTTPLRAKARTAMKLRIMEQQQQQQLDPHLGDDNVSKKMKTVPAKKATKTTLMSPVQQKCSRSEQKWRDCSNCKQLPKTRHRGSARK